MSLGIKFPDYIKRFSQDAANKLAPFVLSGRLNVEFVKGNQNKYINTTRMSLETFRKGSGEVYTEQKHFNRMLPIYLTRFGTLSNNMPVAGFRPQDCSAKRQFDAVKGNDFIKNFLLDVEFKKTYNKLVRHADMYGIAWLKTGIDWSQGDDIATIEASSTNGDKTEKMEYTLKEGRPFIEMVPLHEVLFDNLSAETMDDIHELVHRRVYPLSAIKRKWGISARAEQVEAADVATIRRMATAGSGSMDMDGYAYVYEYYKKPNATHPHGRYSIMVNNNVFYDGTLPYQNSSQKRKIPFDFVALQDIPNYTVGVTVYSQIIPIQETFNAIKNRFLEYMNHVAIGQMYYWEGSLTNIKTFTTRPGKLIGLKRGAKPPQPVVKDKISNEFISYLRTLEEDMLIAAGLSQLTAYGNSKSNVRTDGVVDKISESDQNKLVNAIENLSSCIIEAFKKVLYCEKERVAILNDQLHAHGKDSYATKYRLEHVDPEQLTIVNRDFLMQSDQQIDKKLSQATQLGLYNPEMNLSYLSKIQFMDALQCNYLRDTLDPNEKVTHDLIEDEHYRMLEQNELAKVEQYHLHQQHLEEHNVLRISSEVRMLEETDPDRYKILMQMLNTHIQQHEQFVQSASEQNVYKDAKAIMSGTARQRPSQG